MTRLKNGRGPKSFGDFLAEAHRVVQRDAALPPLKRKPVGWCNYPGDVTNGLPFAAGPNMFGELLYPVEASYDAEAGVTRVGWSFIAPGEKR